MRTKDAAAVFGGKKRLAEQLGISPSAVTMWGEYVPESRQYQIEVLTKGELRAGLGEETAIMPASRRAARKPNDRRGRRETDLSTQEAQELLESAEKLTGTLQRIAKS